MAITELITNNRNNGRISNINFEEINRIVSILEVNFSKIISLSDFIDKINENKKNKIEIA